MSSPIINKAERQKKERIFDMKEKVILFDGTSLDGFTRRDGSPARWELHDGCMTVSRGGGDIVSKFTYGRKFHKL